jgi:hypothetical protein
VIYLGKPCWSAWTSRSSFDSNSLLPPMSMHLEGAEPSECHHWALCEDSHSIRRQEKTSCNLNQADPFLLTACQVDSY